MKKSSNSLAFHKDGFNMLKFIHKCDNSAIPLCLIYSFINALYPYINIIMTSYVIDNIINKNFRYTVYSIVVLLGLNFLFGVLQDYTKNKYHVKMQNIHNKANKNIIKHALGLDYEVIENPKVLELISSADYSMQHNGGFSYFIQMYCDMVEALFSIIFSIVIVFEVCLKTAAVGGSLQILTSTPISIIFITVFIFVNTSINLKLAKYMNDKSIKLFNEHMQFERRFDYITFSTIYDITKGKIIRLYNMKGMILKESQDNEKKSVKGFIGELIKLMSNQSYVSITLAGISILFAYTFVILKVIVKAITIGAMTKYIGCISQLSEALIKLFKSNDEIRVQCSYLGNINKFMDIKNIRNTGSIPVEKRDDNEYEIEFHNVSFKYPNTNDLILNNVSCKLTLKNKMAVVGRNGAGKSTFIKLLCRLYDPTDGYITLNGIDIRKYDYNQYLNLFGVVFQDFKIFACLLEQNVAASTSPDKEKVWQSLELAGLKERVEQMPQDIETPLFKYDDGGIELSGGEAQKVAIARALYKDAPFVILDEPTAALDPLSEYEIYARFDELVEDKTSIYISHRMSSCRFCNDIIVFDKGSIVQRGSHENLMNENEGLYQKMWNSQAKYYQNNNIKVC